MSPTLKSHTSYLGRASLGISAIGPCIKAYFLRLEPPVPNHKVPISCFLKDQIGEKRAHVSACSEKNKSSTED